MFKFKELAQVQIEITSRCQASCPMCSRNVYGGLDNPLLELADWTLDNFKIIFTAEILAQIRNINFAGSFGEPIVHNQLIEMCQYLKDTNDNVSVTICTNGSARNTEWWQQLADALPRSHRVVFALDGLADTHSLYRIGTDFNRIIENAKSFIAAGGTAEWQFIQFKHNQHQVSQAKQLANELGFKSFVLKNSRRHGEPMPVVDSCGQVTHHLEAATESPVKIIRRADFVNYQSWDQADVINCYAKQDKEIFIDAHYTMLPCCILPSFFYLDVDYNQKYYKQYNLYTDASHYDAAQGVQSNFQQLIDQLGGVQSLNAVNHGIKNIIESEVWQTIWERKWREKSSTVCIKLCSASSPFTGINEQRSDSIL